MEVIDSNLIPPGISVTPYGPRLNDKTNKLLANPNFLQALDMIPNGDVKQFLELAKRSDKSSALNGIGEEGARFMVAFNRWENQCCNLMSCETRKGKTFMMCTRCKSKVCGTLCQGKYHKKYKHCKNKWTPIRHHLYIKSAQIEIETVLMVWSTGEDRKNLLWTLPKEILFLVFTFVAADKLDEQTICIWCGFHDKKLGFCNKCYLVQYCSADCKEKDFKKHSKRCCQLDGPLDDGPQRLVMFKLPDSKEKQTKKTKTKRKTNRKKRKKKKGRRNK